MQNNGIDQMRINDVFSVAGWVLIGLKHCGRWKYGSKKQSLSPILYYVFTGLHIYICRLNISPVFVLFLPQLCKTDNSLLIALLLFIYLLYFFKAQTQFN